MVQRVRLRLPLMGGTAGGEGGIPVERSRRREPESLPEGGRSPPPVQAGLNVGRALKGIYGYMSSYW